MLNKIFNSNSYIVGGCIRDYFFSRRDIKDIDIVCISSVNDFKKMLREISKKFTLFPLDRERDVWRAYVSKELSFDISRASDLLSDVMRRDFTVNSLAVNVKDACIRVKNGSFDIKFKDKKIIDITKKGLDDIDKRIIKHTNKNIFDDDPLRILRAFRLSAQFDLKIHPSTQKLIIEKKNLLKDVAPERIRDEIIKMASSNNFAFALRMMIKTGVLFELFCEFKKQIGCAEIYYGKGGVIKHTLSVVERLDIYFEDPLNYTLTPPSLIKKLEEEKYLIKIAGLFHDIAKPHTAALKGDRLRFFGHEQKGAEITSRYLEKFRFSNKDIDYISSIIKNHLRIGSIASNNPLTKKAILRVFYDMKQYSLGLCVLSWADYSSHIKRSKLLSIIDRTKKYPQTFSSKIPKSGLRKTIRYMQVVNLMLRNYHDFNSMVDIKPLLDGNDIMSLLSIPPSPLVGKIKKRLINLQIDGKITSKEKAIEYVKSFAKNLYL